MDEPLASTPPRTSYGALLSEAEMTADERVIEIPPVASVAPLLEPEAFARAQRRQPFSQFKQRRQRRKTRRAEGFVGGGDVDKWLPVSAHCTCSTYNLKDLVDFWDSRQDGLIDSVTVFSEVIHLRKSEPQRDVFVFEFGVVCAWNLPVAETNGFIELLSAFAEGPLDASDHHDEDFEYCYSPNGQAQVSRDQIILSSEEGIEKLSVSFALAQCVKLETYEERVGEEIEKSRYLPVRLARSGKVGLTRTELAKKVGQLFIERNRINVQFDVMDTPDFFWEQDKFKHSFDLLFEYLELRKRVGLLNKRIDHVAEMLNMLIAQQNVNHKTRLEHIIIALVLINVVSLAVISILQYKL